MGQEKGNDDNKEKMSIRSEGPESVGDMSRPSAIAAGSKANVRKSSAVSGADKGLPLLSLCCVVKSTFFC